MQNGWFRFSLSLHLRLFLSIVVQRIPFRAALAKLDHSIHTMRLWAAAKAKSLCIDWCMEMFFKVVQNDVNQCLEQIKSLRMPDLVAADISEVEIQVNVALRAKLVSEVKVNICKLKVSVASFNSGAAFVFIFVNLSTK